MADMNTPHPPHSPSAAGRWAAAGAVLAGLAVAAGAFGAHALETVVTPERLGTFETAARYQMYGGLGLLALAALAGGHPGVLRAAPPLLAGALVFSLSLYTLVLTGAGWLGAVAPVGGALTILGWLWAALALLRRPGA